MGLHLTFDIQSLKLWKVGEGVDKTKHSTKRTPLKSTLSSQSK